MSLVRKLIRLFCTPSHRSQVQTGLLPLQDIKSATVFVDENEAGFEPLKLRIKEFFSSRGIEVAFLSAFSKDIRSTSDLFIALNAKPSIDERYAAASSSARFKIGRHALKKGTYGVKTKVTAAGNANYKALTKTVTFKYPMRAR